MNGELFWIRTVLEDRATLIGGGVAIWSGSFASMIIGGSCFVQVGGKFMLVGQA